ncbi:glycosyltransferase family 2 protein [Patescibacteria group bacterium]|nr:glycosyltransferase family 2 protein [Patescibacteria group bacterium]MBU4162390.1 glycosyltransferase family 2 protein [Patescibacteria group bacterium]
MKTAAIIPAYNEEMGLGDVLDVVVNHPLIGEVIVVDDGSTDSTPIIAKEHNASRIIILNENIGKGKALDIGVKNTEAEVILFLDADLIGFKQIHITNLIKPVIDGECEMTVGAIDRSKLSPALNRKLSRIESPFSGMRAIKRSVWDIVPDEYKNKFYIETAITYLAKKKRIKVKPLVLAGVTHITKEKKMGFWKGHLARWKMHWNIVQASVLLRIKRAKKYGFSNQ